MEIYQQSKLISGKDVLERDDATDEILLMLEVTQLQFKAAMGYRMASMEAAITLGKGPAPDNPADLVPIEVDVSTS